MSELIKYVRIDGNIKGDICGMVLATGANQVGWCKVNVKKGDRFDKKLGFVIARGRAEKGTSPRIKIPEDVVPLLEKMRDRAQRYFKPDPNELPKVIGATLAEIEANPALM